VPDVKHFDTEQVLTAVERLFWRQGVASTGIQDIVSVTGLSRSSLYSTFGGKDELYLAALRHYLDERSRPMLDRLVADRRGLPAITAFFDRLIRLRCSGEHARWGCLVSNAHTGDPDPQVRKVLDQHHDALSTAFRSSLLAAHGLGQLSAGDDVDATAEMLTLLAYGVNLRSRSGVRRATLQSGVMAALAPLAKKTRCTAEARGHDLSG
jgi:TetR/AcrR family transcriptional repressor of nem operon